MTCPSITWSYALVCCAAALSSAHCASTVYRPGAGASLTLDGAAEINDDDVRKAFEATPKIPAHPKVAYFTFAHDYERELSALVRAVPGVDTIYRLPNLLLTGRGRYDAGHGWGDPGEGFSLKRARLMAARAHSDVLVLFDYGRRVVRSGNALSVLGVLLVPALLLPMYDIDVDSYLDTYVIDVRNGYLYADLHTEQRGEAGTVTLYSDADERMIAKQWRQLLDDTRQALVQTFVDEQQSAAPTEADLLQGSQDTVE